MKKLIHLALIAWLCCGVAQAQDRVQVQRVITIKNTNLGTITRTIHDLLPGTGVLVTSDNEHLILSGPKDAVNGFEEIIKQLDVPAPIKKNIETSVYMIVASTQAPSGNMPPQLEPVITQLKSVFSYKGYRLLDSFVLRSRDGEHSETSGFVPPQPDSNSRRQQDHLSVPLRPRNDDRRRNRTTGTVRRPTLRNAGASR